MKNISVLMFWEITVWDINELSIKKSQIKLDQKSRFNPIDF